MKNSDININLTNCHQMQINNHVKFLIKINEQRRARLYNTQRQKELIVYTWVHEGGNASLNVY